MSGPVLCNAAFLNDVPRAKEALQGAEDAKALANWADEQTGTTPLYIAAWRGNVEMVDLLLKAGAYVNSMRKQDKATPLFAASQCGHVAAVQRLLQDEATNPDLGMEGYSPLLIATANNHLEVVRALLVAEANPNQADEAGCSPLFVAAGMGQTALVELLLPSAMIDQQNNEEWPPLAAACHRQKMDVVKQLLRAGASVDAIPSGTWEKRLAKKVRNELGMGRQKSGGKVGV